MSQVDVLFSDKRPILVVFVPAGLGIEDAVFRESVEE